MVKIEESKELIMENVLSYKKITQEEFDEILKKIMDYLHDD